MSFYFNGCSYTFGDELNNPSKEAWPTLISNHYGVSFLNDAVSGGTNDRIMNGVVKNINKYDKFYIAWTSYFRFTRQYYANLSEINFNPSMTIKWDKLYDNQLLKHNKSHFTKYANLHYKYWNGEIYAFKQYLQQIIFLQSFLILHKKEFVMMNAFENDLSYWLSNDNDRISKINSLLNTDSVSDEQIIENQHAIQQLVKLIDTSTFIGWNDWYLTKIQKTHDIKVGTNGHFLEEGHHIVMEKIIANA